MAATVAAPLERRIGEIEAKGRHATSDVPFGLGLS